MEGVGRGGGSGAGFIPCGNFHFLQPRPPLTAIDRFLWGQNHFASHQANFLINDHLKNNPISPPLHVPANHVGSTSGAIHSHAGLLPWPTCLQETNCYSAAGVDGVFMDETPNWNVISPTLETNSAGFNGEINKLDQKNSKANGKKERGGGSSMPLIKGQWTEEEDRRLIRLVKNHGIKKWAQIAEKMVGRAGKQCRERWQNHLRPNIKKDSWSEEEERLLVESHMQVGNRWAEIAKRIPGRTENSIKNHWNATKRRQNSRRKSKKPQAQNGKHLMLQSTILQDYIRSTFSNHGSTSSSTIFPLPTATAAAATNRSTTMSDNLLNNNYSDYTTTSDDSASYLTQPTLYDEEMNFIQNLFGNDGVVTTPSMLVDAAPKAKAPLVVADNNLCPDLYDLSLLLDGPPAMTYAENYPAHNVNTIMMEMDEREYSSSVRKEMDLIEMVSPKFHFSPGTASNSFVC